jgi:hypothetical protein
VLLAGAEIIGLMLVDKATGYKRKGPGAAGEEGGITVP